ncbi:LysM peptidoglycan-binding domain-containing protein [Microbacteriaceae bacterium VKM Ac-2855]|nr:LysM peptidoglycan-binding domain-containing protein [Microbacteriaceae bacterium VKM Ac-2855]
MRRRQFGEGREGRSRRRRISLVISAFVVVLALVAGAWLVLPHAGGSKAVGAPRPVPHAPAASVIPRPVVPAGTVVATGTITSQDGRTSGSVEVTAIARRAASAFALLLPTFSTNYGASLEVVASAAPIADDAICLGSGAVYPVGSLASLRRSAVSLSDAKTGGDPSFVDSLALVLPTGDADCVARVVALAQLVWNMPDMRPDIQVVDTGAAEGATGPVNTDAGAVVSYTVVDGDQMAAIANRFDLALDDVLYLNPGRSPDPLDRVAHPGETLNLDKSRR